VLGVLTDFLEKAGFMARIPDADIEQLKSEVAVLANPFWLKSRTPP
jgi:hypothetical protein